MEQLKSFSINIDTIRELTISEIENKIAYWETKLLTSRNGISEAEGYLVSLRKVKKEKRQERYNKLKNSNVKEETKN